MTLNFYACKQAVIAYNSLVFVLSTCTRVTANIKVIANVLSSSRTDLNDYSLILLSIAFINVTVVWEQYTHVRYCHRKQLLT